MAVDDLVPVPEDVARRASECLFVLLGEFRRDLTPAQVEFASALDKKPHLSWRDIRLAHVLYDLIVERRT